MDIKGLTTAEVEKRIEKGLVNIQIDSISKSKNDIIRDNVFTLFNFINIFLAVLIISVGSFKNLLFLGLIFSNTLIGIIQEIRAKKTLDKLALINASKVNVIRNGKKETIDVAEIVMDDIMVLKTGNQICTDSIIIDGSIEVNESLLTGESDNVLKNINDDLLSGSFVVSGTAYAKVIHIGYDNYAAKITKDAKVLKKHPSELRKAMDRILRIVSILIGPLGIGLFLSQFYVSKVLFTNAITGTVAALLGMIPEGLILLTSVALAIGIINLARKKTLVQELFCIETLARVDMLCLDKTGTITSGEMKVENIEELGNIDINDIMGNFVGALDDENATFTALKKRFKSRKNYKIRTSIPFSSERKYSAVSFDSRGTFILGAFEFIFKNDRFKEIKNKIDDYTRKGYRVLTLAASKEYIESKSLPNDLVPIAIILISDIIRKDAAETLEYFARQGVELKIISGDNPLTVSHIASKVSLENADKYIDATNLRSKADIYKAVQNYTVFGRVIPELKKEIVICLKDLGYTVAMTGDGVNDVPALKEANCSIAMAEGSDAAKQCSNIVLLDSNFSSLPHIVNEGRRVINNIQASATLFLVKTFFSILLSILMLIFANPYPFIPIHLTVISAFGIGIPTFILSLEPNYTKVKKGFLINVLQNALNGAIAIVLMICAITIFTSIFKFGEATRSTMCMIVTAITSLYMIKKVFPLTTVLRKIVYFAMFTLFFGSMLFLQDLLSLVDFGYEPTIFLIILSMLSPQLINGIDYILNWFKKVFNRLRRK